MQNRSFSRTNRFREAMVLLFLLPMTLIAIGGDILSMEQRRTSLTFSLASTYRPLLGFSQYQPPGTQKKEPVDSIPKTKSAKKTNRAFLEFLGVIAIPSATYWAGWWGEYKPWHYRLNLEDQFKRFFTLEAWKFDSNSYLLNCSHALAGALYYNIARSNGLNRLESFLFNLGGSFYWEYITEWRTVVSINDNIFNVLGGTAIGEAWHVIGKYFLSKSGIVNQVLSFLNPALRINNWLDRKTTLSNAPEPEPGWHDFRLCMGFWRDQSQVQEFSSMNMFAGIDAQLLRIPDAEKSGDLSQKIGSTLFSEISFDILSSGGLVDEMGLFFRSVYLGHFRKKLDPNSNGYRFYLGIGSAFSFFKQRSVAFYDSNQVHVKDIHLLKLEEPRNFRDKFAAAHIIGPVLDLTVRTSRFRARLMAETYLDFSLVNSLALNEYSIDHDISRAKSTLVYYGYYYGFGGSLGLRLDVEYGPLELRGRYTGHKWGSIEGHDNFQEDIRDDFHMTDSRTFVRLSAGYRFGKSPLVLVLAYEGIGRTGTLKEVTKTVHESRLSMGFVLRF